MLGGGKITAMLATTRPDAARQFYIEVLGLRLVSEDAFAVVCDWAGTALRLQKVQAHTPHPFTALGWSVPDIQAAAKDLAARGVVFERFAGMEQDEAGVWTPPGASGGVCWFKDPDGNLLSLASAG